MFAILCSQQCRLTVRRYALCDWVKPMDALDCSALWELPRMLWDFSKAIKLAVAVPSLGLILVFTTNGIVQSLTGRAMKIEAVNESTVLTVGSEAQLRV